MFPPNSCNDCSPCVDCGHVKTVYVHPVHETDKCDNIVDMLKDLVTVGSSGCNLKLRGVNNAGTVALLANEENVLFSSDGITYSDESIFVNQPCGQKVYFAKNVEGCIDIVKISINCQCSPIWAPKNPAISHCIGGKINVRYADGCGNEEWRPTATDCVDNTEFCSKQLALVPPSISCNQGNLTTVVLSVTGNEGNMVQFFSPMTNQWESANSGQNGFQFTAPSNGQTIAYKARLNSCTTEFTGYIKLCNASQSEFTATRSQTVNCPVNCSQPTILFTKTYTASTQAAADNLATQDPNFAQLAANYAAAHCICGTFSASLSSMTCDNSLTPSTPLAPAPMAVYYRITRCSDSLPFYTSTVISTLNQRVTDNAGVVYTYSGSYVSSPTPPSGNIGVVTKIDETGCGSGACSLSVQAIGIGSNISVINPTGNTIQFCYQPAGQSIISSASIPPNSSVYQFCVNGTNFSDNSELLNISIGQVCGGSSYASYYGILSNLSVELFHTTTDLSGVQAGHLVTKDGVNYSYYPSGNLLNIQNPPSSNVGPVTIT